MSDMVSIVDYYHYEMFPSLNNGQKAAFWGNLCHV